MILRPKARSQFFLGIGYAVCGAVVVLALLETASYLILAARHHFHHSAVPEPAPDSPAYSRYP